MNGVHRMTVDGRTVSRGYGVRWPERLREIWQFRHLLRHLVVRDLKVKYQPSRPITRSSTKGPSPPPESSWDRRAGGTIVVVSHDLTAVADMCHRAAWIEWGRVRESGPAAEVVERYRTASAAAGHDRE